MSNKKDGRKNNQPPKSTQFKKGQSGNPFGRPKKKKSTFEEELQRVFGRERQIKIDGEYKVASAREVIFERVAVGAVSGDAKMIQISISLMKNMDDAPEFEPLPEDQKVLNHFKSLFNDDGSKKDDSNEE